jgi:hypothetical protein
MFTIPPSIKLSLRPNGQRLNYILNGIVEMPITDNQYTAYSRYIEDRKTIYNKYISDVNEIARSKNAVNSALSSKLGLVMAIPEENIDKFNVLDRAYNAAMFDLHSRLDTETGIKFGILKGLFDKANFFLTQGSLQPYEYKELPPMLQAHYTEEKNVAQHTPKGELFTGSIYKKKEVAAEGGYRRKTRRQRKKSRRSKLKSKHSRRYTGLKRSQI